MLVKVSRISSYTDPEKGLSGKQIELVEVRRKEARIAAPGLPREESMMLMGIFAQLQSMGLLPQIREFTIPKLILFLSEDEYDMLGIRFEVNDVYELEFKNGRIELRKATESSMTRP